MDKRNTVIMEEGGANSDTKKTLLLFIKFLFVVNQTLPIKK